MGYPRYTLETFDRGSKSPAWHARTGFWRKPTFEGPSQEIYGVKNALFCFLNKNIWRPRAVFKKDLKSLGAPYHLIFFVKQKVSTKARREAGPSFKRPKLTKSTKPFLLDPLADAIDLWMVFLASYPLSIYVKTSYRRYLPAPGENAVVPLQGYLAHKTAPPHLGTP